MQAIRAIDTRRMARDEWVQARRKGIGGSDISVIAGLNPWKSPIALYLEKTGELPDQEPAEHMEWGNRLEGLVADYFAEQHPDRKVLRVNSILQHPEYPWALANVDRRVIVKNGEPGILEIKTTSEWMRHDWEDGKAPLHAQAQLQWYMGIVGYSRGWIAALIGGRRYVEVEIERDDEVIKTLLDMAKEFWHCVETRTPPAWDGSQSSTDLLNRLHPEGNPGEEVSLPPATSLLLRQYEDAKADERAAKERRTEAENRIKALLGDAEVGLIAGEPAVTWKAIHTNRLDTKALKEQRPDIYDEFVRTSVSRRFDVRVREAE